MSKKVSNLKIQPALPAGWLICEGADPAPAPDALVALGLELWAAKQAADLAAQAEMGLRAAVLADDDLAPGTTLVIDGHCRVTCRRGSVTPKINNVEAVRSLLGPRFADLVTIKTSAVPTEKLVGLASDADDPLGMALRPYVKVTTGEPSLSVVAVKPATGGAA